MPHRCRADTVAHEPGMISAQGYDQLRQPDTVSLCSSTRVTTTACLGVGQHSATQNHDLTPQLVRPSRPFPRELLPFVRSLPCS